MIHRAEGEDDASTGDPFLSQGPTNPLLTHALSSSLWELYNQRSHYHSCKAFTKPEYMCHGRSPRSYISLCDAFPNETMKSWRDEGANLVPKSSATCGPFRLTPMHFKMGIRRRV
ncbi:hypothetical protein JOM56_000748 [Amanita muscaria]